MYKLWTKKVYFKKRERSPTWGSKLYCMWRAAAAAECLLEFLRSVLLNNEPAPELGCQIFGVEPEWFASMLACKKSVAIKKWFPLRVHSFRKMWDIMISHALLCVFDILKSHSRPTQVTLNECCSQIIKKMYKQGNIYNKNIKYTKAK